ncbi:uncharacterized protein LOC142788364 [Rhipicephalus microplus]|uniref:uncharacterized protein LOC142788364 n=1 Tax=Rhipicephalus microplus TaxID=6941 RepID=UPI003F6B72F1
MSARNYCAAMRLTNQEQRSLILEVINRSELPNKETIRVFLTGPAGCGKTFTIDLLKHAYNRLHTSPGSASNAYVTMATTGKAASAIEGITVYMALKITTKQDDRGLSHSDINTYRCAFRNVKAMLLDEVNMMGSEVLVKADERLRQITQNFQESFGSLSVYMCGDFRQLSPIKATEVYRRSARQVRKLKMEHP